MKRITAILLVILLAFNIPSSFAIDDSMPFTDVNEESWYYKAVKYNYDNGLIKGMSNDTFGVDVVLTRAMVVTILAAIEEIDVSEYKESHFNDVKVAAWYAPYVEWAYQNEVVAGYGENFGPDDPLTREQMALILYKYSIHKNINTEFESLILLSNFNDYDNISDWSEDAMLWAVNLGLLSGYTDRTLRPLAGLKRSEAAIMLYNYHYMLKNGELPRDTSAADALTIKPGEGYRIICWGDSLTAGGGSPKDYPGLILSYLRLPVKNYGVGGETAEVIAIRQGGIPVFAKPFTIPADTTAVPLTLEDVKSNSTDVGYFGTNGLNPVIIGGVEGKLVFNGDDRKHYFTRTEPGDEVVLTRTTQIITYGMADRQDKDIQVIFIGSNNRYGVNSVQKLIDIQKEMIKYSGTTKYIIVGLTSKAYMPQVAEVNEVLKEEFGEKFLDIREYLLTDGLQDIEITPTEKDLEDIANGEIPSSLRSDEIHGNIYFYTLLARQVIKKINDLGYMN